MDQNLDWNMDSHENLCDLVNEVKDEEMAHVVT